MLSYYLEVNKLDIDIKYFEYVLSKAKFYPNIKLSKTYILRGGIYMNMKRKISGKKLYFNVESLLINFKLNYNFSSFLIFFIGDIGHLF